jgi:hypothetical protein
MDKTDLMQGEENDPLSGMTSEDIARYLLDALVVDFPKDMREFDLRLKLASQYIELAKAYIIAGAIREAADIIADWNEPRND